MVKKILTICAFIYASLSASSEPFTGELIVNSPTIIAQSPNTGAAQAAALEKLTDASTLHHHNPSEKSEASLKAAAEEYNKLQQPMSQESLANLKKVVAAAKRVIAETTEANKALLQAAVDPQQSVASQPAASSNTQNEYTIKLESGLPTAFAVNGNPQNELPEALSFLQDYFATPVTQTDEIKNRLERRRFLVRVQPGNSKQSSQPPRSETTEDVHH